MAHYLGMICFIAPFVFAYLSVRTCQQRKLRAAQMATLGEDDRRMVADLHSLAARIETRMANLERILDSELATWRNGERV